MIADQYFESLAPQHLWAAEANGRHKLVHGAAGGAAALGGSARSGGDVAGGAVHEDELFAEGEAEEVAEGSAGRVWVYP